MFSPGGAWISNMILGPGVARNTGEAEIQPQILRCLLQTLPPILVMTSSPFHTEFWLPGDKASIPHPSSGEQTLHN